jgi:hypothetical protein
LRARCAATRHFSEQNALVERVDIIGPPNCAEKVHNCGLSVPSRESHIRPLPARLEHDDDRIAVWSDVLATTNGARIKAADVDNADAKRLPISNSRLSVSQGGALPHLRLIPPRGRASPKGPAWTLGPASATFAGPSLPQFPLRGFDKGGPRSDFTYTFLSSVPATRRSPWACAASLS